MSMTLLITLFILSGVFLAVLGIPMALGRVRPNSLYGFRTTATIEDPDLWYPANRYAGQRMIEAGVVLALASAALAFLGLSVDGYAIACTAFLLAAMAIVLIRSFRFLRRLRITRSA